MKIDDTFLKNLLQTNKSGVKLSIYQPTHPASTGATVQEDSIRLKNALRAIRSSELYDEASLSNTMESLDELVNDVDFWKYQARGLAVFADQDGYQTARLNYDVTEAHYVGDEYQVSPLVLMQSLGSNYFILDVNLTNPRLFEGSPASCSQVEVSDMPGSFETMVENVEFQNGTQFQSAGVGSYHGDNDEAALEDNVMRYYRRVAEAVDKHLVDNKEPLVLIGVPNAIGAMRQLFSYSGTLDEHVEGSAEAMNEQAVYESTIPIIEKHNAQRRLECVEKFNETPPERAAVGVQDVQNDITEQRVATLLLPSFRLTTDTVREGFEEAIVLQLDEESGDTESLVRGVIAQGGEVMAMPLDAFEDTQPRAICRF